MAWAASSITGTPARDGRRHDRIEIRAQTEQVHRQDRSRSRVYRRGKRAGSTLKVAGSMSTKTGARAEPGNDAGGREKRVGRVIDFVARPDAERHQARAAAASVPDDTAMACPTPSMRASSPSSAAISGPMMKRWLSQTRVIAARISSRSGRYCALRSRRGTMDADRVGMSPSRVIISRVLIAARRFAIGFAPLDRLALVVFLLALGEADGHLHAAVLEVHPNGHEGHALLDRLANQLANLVPVQQQLARSQRLVVGVTAMAVRD